MRGWGKEFMRNVHERCLRKLPRVTDLRSVPQSCSSNSNPSKSYSISRWHELEGGGLIGEIQSMGSEYDVFLNFRGPDARKGISDHLFQSMTKAGLHVFKDDEKFHRGEEIGIELERAINDSKIYVVVFTKDYASSAWCLRELTMMVDRRRASSAGEKVILPIFYDVDPDYSKLRRLPGSIGQLSSLQSLHLSNSRELLELPATICGLSSLRSLQLVGCNMLQELPELPAGLTNLEFTSSSLRLVPDLSLLMDLNELKLGDSYYDSPQGVPDNIVSQSQPIQLPWLGELCKLKSLEIVFMRIPILLPPDMSSLTRLEKLELSCMDPESLPLLPRYLSSWSFSYFRGTVPWTRYSGMIFLHRLELCNSALTEIRLNGLEKLENLRNLGVQSCNELVRVLDLASLRQVRLLWLAHCPKLVDISGLEQMTSLEDLYLTRCESIQRIPDLSNSRRMKHMVIRWCNSLLSLPGVFDECNLTIQDCKHFRDFDGPIRGYFCRARPPEFIERWFPGGL